MNSEKFTQGEWCLRTIDQFAEYGNPTRHIFEKKENGTLGKSIATVSKNENDLAIADLISAAPDMFRVLQGICGEKSARICEYAPESCKVCLIRKALKKARGEYV